MITIVRIPSSIQHGTRFDQGKPIIKNRESTQDRRLYRVRTSAMVN